MKRLSAATGWKLSCGAAIAIAIACTWFLASSSVRASSLKARGSVAPLTVMSMIRESHSRGGARFTYDVRLANYRFWFDTRLKLTLGATYNAIYDSDAYARYRAGERDSFDQIILGTMTDSTPRLVANDLGAGYAIFFSLGLPFWIWQAVIFARKSKKAQPVGMRRRERCA